MRRDVSSEDRPKIRAAVERAIASQPEQAKAAMVRRILGRADSIIDGSRCARQSIVMVNAYRADEGGDAGRPRSEKVTLTTTRHRGETIRPHDELIVVHERGKAIFRDSDLAIVVLNTPVEELVPAIKLPRTAVQLGLGVVMVGYGFGSTERGSISFGDRHVAESRVVEIAGSDSPGVQFAVREEPGDGGIPAGMDFGDSGGPCFGRSSGDVLLGIASGISTEDVREKLSYFTSIYPARDWVRRVAREAGETVH